MLSIALLAACDESRSRDADTATEEVQAGCATRPPEPVVGTRVIAAYFSCHRGAPGQLYPAYRVASAIRLSFDGSEQAFWSWLGGPVRAFTRRDWERV